MEKRNYKIVKSFVEGSTYQSIGDKHFITRERVRQILNRYLEPYQIKEIIKNNRCRRQKSL